jgi:glycogen debranching enzyme
VIEAARARPVDPFVIETPDGPDVVPGYPARKPQLADTAIAYEGLFLTTGRHELGRELLIARTHQALEVDDGSPAAPLWLVHAVDRHVSRTGDTDLAAELAVPLGRLLRLRLGGGGPLRVDADELVHLSKGPRIGKAVEINALWVNALAALGDLLTVARKDASEPRTRHGKARSRFAARFPAPEGWLHDVIEGPPATYPLGAGATHDDATLRPGQLLAWSLPHAALPADASALRAIGPSLLTPLGLRTLSPREYGYQPAAAGEGAVRPWLIGAWADACVAAGLPIEGLLTGLEAHLGEWGLGSVSEWAGGDPPYPAGGCPFSARSVAEFRRVQGMSA